MNDKDFQKYLQLIMSMCIDCMSGGISKKTFIANLKFITNQLIER